MRVFFWKRYYGHFQDECLILNMATIIQGWIKCRQARIHRVLVDTPLRVFIHPAMLL